MMFPVGSKFFTMNMCSFCHKHPFPESLLTGTVVYGANLHAYLRSKWIQWHVCELRLEQFQPWRLSGLGTEWDFCLRSLSLEEWWVCGWFHRPSVHMASSPDCLKFWLADQNWRVSLPKQLITLHKPMVYSVSISYILSNTWSCSPGSYVPKETFLSKLSKHSWSGALTAGNHAANFLSIKSTRNVLSHNSTVGWMVISLWCTLRGKKTFQMAQLPLRRKLSPP